MGFGNNLGKFGLKMINGVAVPYTQKYLKDRGYKPKPPYPDFSQMRKDVHQSISDNVIKEMCVEYNPFTITEEEKKVFSLENHTISGESYRVWCQKQEEFQEQKL